MQKLIEDLLEFSKVGRDKDHFELFEMRDAVDEALNNLNNLIEDNDAVITCDVLPCLVLDKAMMTQLFQNLIGNAVKFHGDEKPRIHISVSKGEDSWLFSVRDNGIGLQKAMQLKSKRTARYKSRGIEITRERLKLFNSQNNQGDVIFNDLEKGTEVIIKIPQ